ncbi:MAG TPA: Hpt domain-containing protein [Acidiferrobacterales bacterium]|nr:Hpt domain-containing protein [Acidiferrobacterales bacterium]
MDADTINTILRAAHSIKGGSGTFGFSEAAKFTHVLETLLNEMRDGRRAVTPDAVNLLLQSVDVLREMLTAVRSKDAVNHARVNQVHGQLEQMLQAGATSRPCSGRCRSARRSSSDPGRAAVTIESIVKGKGRKHAGHSNRSKRR